VTTVGVVLCTYQGRRWIEAFLASLVAQTRPPDVVIVSDDGSSDGTDEIVSGFASRAPFPVEVSSTERRLGPARNFERALGRCQADLVALADQDDLWYPTKLARLEAVLTAADDERGLAFSDADVIDADGGPTGQSLWDGVGFRARRRRRLERSPMEVLLGRSVVTGACTMVTAAGLQTALPLPEALDEPAAPMLHDRWLALVLGATGRVHAVDERLVGFRVHDDQQTGLRDPITPREVAGQLTRARSDRAVFLAGRIAQFEALYERVAGHPGAATVAEAVDHLRVRLALDPSRWRRLAPVAREWATGRYRRYSTGGGSAVADVVRPP
jgi:glycosyltransferase involved in cell wall biosynthesis